MAAADPRAAKSHTSARPSRASFCGDLAHAFDEACGLAAAAVTDPPEPYREFIVGI
jgi:hypothetical protein